jgi:aromatic ring-opening dioxygenase catalytic subunit (LigB family)
MTTSTQGPVVQVSVNDLVAEFNRRGAEIRRLHEERALLLAACKIALPYLKTDDAREIVREAIARARR